MTNKSNPTAEDKIAVDSLKYHRNFPAGKMEISTTKPMASQYDLALAYSPGVAAASTAIKQDPTAAGNLTIRNNLVAVISNGTAVLGLGDIGPLASKPVMEGKAVLFKKFAGINAFDLEIDEKDPDKLVEIIASLEPTFGAINLEDIRAPECFEVENKLIERLKIPVMHDDQHGTAIISSAALLNALEIQGKDISAIRLVTCGAGAAALACLNLMLDLGLRKENVLVVDKSGVLYQGQADHNPYNQKFAAETSKRTLAEALVGADVFLGLSAGKVLHSTMVETMADKPIVLALANPEPEIRPELVFAVRDDAIVATGRSDYPNQVNNVLCFPFIFRAALDVGATVINQEMKIACVKALSGLAKEVMPAIVHNAYGGEPASFSREYIIPKPFDPRLMASLTPAVAQAAMDTGVATRPIADINKYKDDLAQFSYRTSFVMKPIFEQAKKHSKRLVLAEGEEPRVLEAAQQILDDNIAHVILVGRPEIIEKRIAQSGLRLQINQNIEVVDPNNDQRFTRYWTAYHKIMGRHGVTPDSARTTVRTSSTVIAALHVHLNDADVMLCGVIGPFKKHLNQVQHIIGCAPSTSRLYALSGLTMDSGTYFFSDTHITVNPTSDELVECTLLAAKEVERFGLEPHIALLSHSNFGSRDNQLSRKMRSATAKLHLKAPHLSLDGEMHATAAVMQGIRDKVLGGSHLKGKANLFIMPDVDSANISYSLLRGLSNAVSIGPIIMGSAKPAHIMTNFITVRGILNTAALAVADASNIATV